eukprot:XP_765971.1 blood-stage antigen [Theileria parva strain Muguga]
MYKIILRVIFLLFYIGYTVVNVFGFWETDFVKDSKSMPSIEIKLAPPENPLPQVEEEIKLLESNRIELEEGMMSRLEQEYNNALMNSKEKIKTVINDSLSVFDNKELIAELLSKYAHQDHKSKNVGGVSFLQTDEAYVPSSVRMSEVEPPDPSIKEKMVSPPILVIDFRTKLSKREMMRKSKKLQKVLQLQLNPYLIETEKLKTAFQHFDQGNVYNVNHGNYANPVSFLQTQASDLSEIRQLNVKIGQSDTPYPTVEDYVMNMEKKRDVSEKLARNKILNMYLNLMKAQHEMIADELHQAVSRVISQYSGIVEEANKGTFNKSSPKQEMNNKNNETQKSTT